MPPPAKSAPTRDSPASSPMTQRPSGGGPAPVTSIRDLKVHCSTCSMRELCLPMGLGAAELAQVDALLGSRVKLRKGDTLYRVGEKFNALYAIRIGSLKTTVLAEDGREQVSGY